VERILARAFRVEALDVLLIFFMKADVETELWKLKKNKCHLKRPALLQGRLGAALKTWYGLARAEKASDKAFCSCTSGLCG